MRRERVMFAAIRTIESLRETTARTLEGHSLCTQQVTTNIVTK